GNALLVGTRSGGSDSSGSRNQVSRSVVRHASYPLPPVGTSATSQTGSGGTAVAGTPVAAGSERIGSSSGTVSFSSSTVAAVSTCAAPGIVASATRRRLVRP